MKHISMTSMPVEDVPKAFRYYIDTLQWQEVIFMPEMELAIVKPLPDSQTTMILEPMVYPEQRVLQQKYAEKNLPTIMQESEDVEKDYKEMTTRGVEFVQPPTVTSYGTVATYSDQQGNLIQLIKQQS